MRMVILRTNGDVVTLGGYNLQEIGLARALIRKGIQCDVIYFNGDNDTFVQELIVDNNKKINVYWVKGVSIALNGFFYNLDSILANYDLIQVSEYDQFTSIYLAFFSRFKNKVLLYHGPYESDFNKKYLMKCSLIRYLPVKKRLKETVPVFAKSYLAKKFLEMNGMKNIIVTGVGLDVERFRDTEIFPQTARLLDTINKEKVLLYVGKIEPRRNIIFLINLLAEIVKEDRDIKLLLIGDGKSKYLEECFKLIDKLNLRNNLIYIKKLDQSQLSHVYLKASVFLLPTSYEIFGMVLMEAMYYGVPTITNYNGGSDTLIEDNVNGIVLDLNLTTWKNSILNILNNKDIGNNMGAKARETITNNFLWDNIADKMLPVYRKICETNRYERNF